jgi:hypothetical protein
MLIRIGKFLLLIQFGMTIIMYNSSCKTLSSSGTHSYTFDHVRPFKNVSEAKEVVDSSHMIKPESENPKKVSVEKKAYAIIPEKIDSVTPNDLPSDDDSATPVKETKIKISKRE